ncbi:MAG: tRNA 2-thiouridine(34) synthase MnmA [Bacteroidetes bacterium]|nr:tRNA 2-thiouridine(34) synthase MnmA [Bacteroidota bacterium]MCW5897308.1 tRNA 2-thiouridine(34) synthase MnmA [Bacteroidota bacterium]
MADEKKKVVVAMSGGVDSSVVAGILSEQGYELIGITIKTYRYEDVGGNVGSDSSCCSLDGINDARSVATKLGFPHYVLDFSERFGAEVIDNFVDEYLNGRTPNPCVICNRKIKWEELIRKSDALGAEYIATGHYAKVKYNETTGRYFVSRGRDESKDQSYALWGLTQESLSKTLFPLADLTKPESRALGEKFGLPNMRKGESYEICFIPDNNYERFLKERVPQLEEQVSDGEIILDGEVVGRHRGFPFYTIGQRKGIGIARPEPLYVTSIDAATNRIGVGREDKLYARGLIARSVNMQKYAECTQPLNVHAKIRYKDPGGDATIKQTDDGTVEVMFDEKRRAITPGQSVVFYEQDDIVGGGIIDAAIT